MTFERTTAERGGAAAERRGWFWSRDGGAAPLVRRWRLFEFGLCLIGAAMAAAGWAINKASGVQTVPEWAYGILLAALFASLVAMSWRARRLVRRLREADLLLCPWCGYDVRASELPCTCPECGTKLDEEAIVRRWTRTFPDLRYPTAGGCSKQG